MRVPTDEAEHNPGRRGPVVLVLGSAFAVSLFLFRATVIHLYSASLENVYELECGRGEVAQGMAAVCNESIAMHLRTITAVPHIAGTPANMETAAYVDTQMKKFGLEVHTSDFPALLGYPISQRVAILNVGPTPFNLSLREASFEADPYSQDPRASTPFLGYSPSGRAAAKVVYANFGRTEDFEYLSSINVSCEGTVVLMRYGEIYRGDKVANAAKHGALAALIYSDPQQEAPEGTSPSDTYPSTQWLPDSGVQRGSIICGTPGDPRTPGWPSCTAGEGGEGGGCEAYDLETLYGMGVLPTIPAVPISYGNAERILREMGGALGPATWQGGLPGLAYRIGPGPVEVEVEVHSNITVATVRDVIGVLKGAEEPDRYVVVGNHRDAWVFGAADPNSGTACLLELARVLQVLTSAGWVPRRTIVLASWDGEEHNLVGSTEWVEKNLPLLGVRAVACLNVDVAVSGQGFDAAATPQLDDLVRHVIGMVQDPDGPPGQSVLDSYRQETNSSTPPLGRLGGGGSDFAAFLQHAGIPSMDFSFGGDYPMYHSVYDNYHWMNRFGDPGFHRHVAATRIMLGIALNLSMAEILPLNYSAYAAELAASLEDLNRTLSTKSGSSSLNLDPLAKAVQDLASAATVVETEAQALATGSYSSGRSSTAGSGRETAKRQVASRDINDRLTSAERGLLDPKGLNADFSWYKHVVYGPEADNGYGTDVFPALQDSLSCLKEKTESFGNSKPSPQPLHLLSRADAGRSLSAGDGKSGSKRHVSGRKRGRRKTSRGLVHRQQEQKKQTLSEMDCASSVQHEIFRVARAVKGAARILEGKLH